MGGRDHATIVVCGYCQQDPAEVADLCGPCHEMMKAALEEVQRRWDEESMDGPGRWGEW